MSIKHPEDYRCERLTRQTGLCRCSCWCAGLSGPCRRNTNQLIATEPVGRTRRRRRRPCCAALTVSWLWFTDHTEQQRLI